jgi:hypothetical protein
LALLFTIATWRQLLGLTDSGAPGREAPSVDSTEILTQLKSWLAGRDQLEQAPRTQLAPLLDA